MRKELKKNYGFALDVPVEEEKQLYAWVVFSKDLIDFWYNLEDLPDIKQVLKDNGWKKTGNKTYENNEVEVIYEKGKCKLMFYYNKD